MARDGLEVALDPCASALSVALETRDPEDWLEFTKALREAEDGRAVDACLASFFAVPARLKHEMMNLILSGQGDPRPPFADHLEEARHWAKFANTPERKAYALAIYEQMNSAERERFHVWARGVDLEDAS